MTFRNACCSSFDEIILDWCLEVFGDDYVKCVKSFYSRSKRSTIERESAFVLREKIFDFIELSLEGDVLSEVYFATVRTGVCCIFDTNVSNV